MKKILALLLVTVLALSFVGCETAGTESSSSSSETSSSSAVSETESSETESSETPSSEAEESSESSESEESSAIALGEKGTLGDWEVTVSKVEFLDTIKDGDFLNFTPEEGNKFAVVSVTIANQGKSSDTFLPSVGFGDDISTKLLYADGYEFSSTYLLGYDLDLHDSTLNPLSSKDGIIAFKVPQQVVDDAESPLLIQFDGPATVTFNLR